MPQRTAKGSQPVSSKETFYTVCLSPPVKQGCLESPWHQIPQINLFSSWVEAAAGRELPDLDFHSPLAREFCSADA